MKKNHLNAIMRRIELISINGTRRDRGRPKNILLKIIYKHFNTLNLIKSITLIVLNDKRFT